MRVFLLQILPPRRVFYAEVVESAEPTTEPRGWLERVERRMQRARERFRESRGTAASHARRIWNWLHARTHPDEPLYSRLRKAHAIDVEHPASLPREEAARDWDRFLAAGQWRHWPWMMVNVFLAPLSIVLTPVPGPNLIGYWFVYRSIHHVLILIGLARARGGRVETRFVAAELLDAPIVAGSAEAALQRLQWLGCDRERALEFLERQGIVAPRAESPGRADGE